MYENEDIILGKLRTNREQLDNMANIRNEYLTDYGVYDGGLVVSAQTVPDMTVKVSAGIIYMPTTYTRYSLAAVASIAVTAADATNPRWDIVYVSSVGVVSYLAGTAAASPSVPATPSGAVKIAEMYVTTGKTSIVAGDIKPRRTFLNNGAWSAWTPVLVWATAIPDGITTVAKHKIVGKTVHFIMQISVTDGNGATALTVSLPTAPTNQTMYPGVSCMTTIAGALTSKLARVRDNGLNDLEVVALGTLTDGATSSIRFSGFYEMV